MTTTAIIRIEGSSDLNGDGDTETFDIRRPLSISGNIEKLIPPEALITMTEAMQI